MKNPHYTKTIFILFKKELAEYFNSPIAYVFIGVFLIVGNWLFFGSFWLLGQASMRSYFELLPWILLFLAPAITMRLWSEEKQSGTIESLLTLPLTAWQVVWAKFFSAFVFLAIALALSFSLPFTIGRLGELDIGAVAGGYLGALFLAICYLALGLFISGLTKNQIVSFILTLAVCFLIFAMTSDMVILAVPSWLALILKSFGLGGHFYNLARGVIDSKDIIYYLSFAGFFLWLNQKTINN